MLRVGAVKLNKNEAVRSSNCDDELEKVMQAPDAIYENFEKNGFAELRGVARWPSVQGEMELTNSDGLLLKPRCSLPLGMENPQLDNNYRRVVLDWLLVERCGVEETE